MPQDDPAAKPSAGRMYDYYLGGTHNFEVDRQAAEQVIKLMPFIPSFARLQRWALQNVAVELTQKRGYDVVIDFASGLPTNDHIHHRAPASTTVIYSDFDPSIVEYTREILAADSPNAHFFQGDASKPEELLNNPDVVKILNGRRKAAFVLWGVSIFMSDEDLKHALQYLYDWAAPGSCLAFNAQGSDGDKDSDAISGTIEMYKRMGVTLYSRSLDHYKELLKPWTLDEPGFTALYEWDGVESVGLTAEDLAAFKPMGGNYSGYLTK
ncbi:MAG: SAM-dependent methyltransferase [Anaerolineales bacterium]|nr:SAM-dependent methyltransferase [Anaerolineales bacterium]